MCTHTHTHTHTHKHIYIYIEREREKERVSWLSSRVSDPKAPFSIATTLRCRGEHYIFPWMLLTFDPYLTMLSVKEGGIKYHF